MMGSRQLQADHVMSYLPHVCDPGDPIRFRLEHPNTFSVALMIRE
jgi:hypothetical protein